MRVYVGAVRKCPNIERIGNYAYSIQKDRSEQTDRVSATLYPIGKALLKS
jgi:hypothetical protein